MTVIGIGYFVTLSDLMKPFRMAVSEFNQDLEFPFKWIVDKFDGVVNCIYCCSFWVGLGVYVGIYEVLNIHTVFSAFSVLGVIYVVKNIFPKH